LDEARDFIIGFFGYFWGPLAILNSKKITQIFIFNFTFLLSFVHLLLGIFGCWITPSEASCNLWHIVMFGNIQPWEEIMFLEQQVTFLEELKSEVNASDSTRIVSLLETPEFCILFRENLPLFSSYWKAVSSKG